MHKNLNENCINVENLRKRSRDIIFFDGALQLDENVEYILYNTFAGDGEERTE